MENAYDFCGYVTRNDIRCSDGRTIRKGAFQHQDGAYVPLVWNHLYDDPVNVLGRVRLEHREDGVYGYGEFNSTPLAQTVKEQVMHKDITAMSIHANNLVQTAERDVLHGKILEVSLVLAGANPGASIQNVVKHGEMPDDEVYIYTGLEFEDIGEVIEHADDANEESVDDIIASMNEKQQKVFYACVAAAMGDASDDISHSDDSICHAAESAPGKVIKAMTDEQKIVAFVVMMCLLTGKSLDSENGVTEHTADVFMSMTEEQQNAIVQGAALMSTLRDRIKSNKNSKGGNKNMKHNAFEGQDVQGAQEVQTETITHSEMLSVIKDGKRYGSMRESVLQHGIEHIDYLFPDDKNLTRTPIFIQRDTGWVSKVMGAISRSPFSRVKSMFADITEDEARAKGYIKGKLKKEEVFSLLKRSTSPTTVYKKQKIDRDDAIDITDFDVISWLKTEMRGMLDEELARAFLIGDGRLISDDDHINTENIRPVWTDSELFTIKARFDGTGVSDGAAKAKKFIETAIRSRKNYKGSGNPTLYTTEDMLTEMLLLTDEMGRDLYDTVEKLAKKLRVKEIVTVPVMENQSREESGQTYELLGLIVNMGDYNVGADKGGAVNMFDDFDIDYNQMKYLIETRCSGALTRPHSAIVVEMKNPM